jgi:hypothetical protein
MIAFPFVNVNATNGNGNTVNWCARHVAPIYHQLLSLQAQLVKATYRGLNKPIATAITAYLQNAEATLDNALTGQSDCNDLKPAVNALDGFNFQVTSWQSTINSQLGNGTTQSWLSQSDNIITQILLICQCSV